MSNIELPLVIEIEPTLTCNLRCRMCHVSFMPDEPRAVLDPIAIDKLGALRGCHFIIGSGFEPMMNRGFSAIVNKIARIGGSMELTTNGTLLKEENINALLDADLRQITFSFDGIEPETYEHIRRRSNYRETIDAILDFRRRFSEHATKFAINSTMMRRNLPEVGAIVDFWDKADFDLVRFISMVIRENEPELIRESLYPVRSAYHDVLDAAALDIISKNRRIAARSPWYRRSALRAMYSENFVDDLVRSNNSAVRILDNPRQRLQLGAGPGMAFPCKSPWTFARVMPNADVQLCYQFTVGNLATQSFEEIWFGEGANEVRRRVARDRPLCESCDYFRFCIRSAGVDDDDKHSYLAGPLLSGVDTIDFDRGTMESQSDEPPILIESIGAFNVVRLNRRYLGVPQALGPVDLGREDLSALPGLLIGESLREVQRLIKTSQLEC